MKNIYTFLISCMIGFISCKSEKTEFDATGTFEATEVIVSAEAAGTLSSFNVNEGQAVKAGQEMGSIDSTQLYLKRKQLLSQIKALLSRSPDIALQVSVLEEQLKHAEKEKQRINNLLKDNAATQKQLDDLNSQIAVLERQIAASRSSLGITANGLYQETNPLNVQIEQLNDQLAKCRIKNPVAGTVLAKYAEEKETTAPGKPLYKVADLNTMILRAYINGKQLPLVKPGQSIKVYTDSGKDSYKEHEGTIEWISDKAEFTPKTIQTKDERANLVYAIKIRVKNDGSIKLGMYGEVKFQPDGKS